MHAHSTALTKEKKNTNNKRNIGNPTPKHIPERRGKQGESEDVKIRQYKGAIFKITVKDHQESSSSTQVTTYMNVNISEKIVK